jgi:hypothetical protein
MREYLHLKSTFYICTSFLGLLGTAIGRRTSLYFSWLLPVHLLHLPFMTTMVFFMLVMIWTADK